MDISVVIPLYRSSQTLRPLVRRLVAVLEHTGQQYEVVLVDDASPDDSWAVALELHTEFGDRIVAIQLTRNFGQHNALMCGFRHTRGEFIITLDDDLQHPPEEIPKLIAAIQGSTHDLVYGAYLAKRHSRFRNFGSALIQAFTRLVFKSPVPITSFRIIRRELLESCFSYNLNFTFVDGLLAWNTARIGQVAVDHHERERGRSGYSLGRLLLHTLNVLTNFSLLPLQIVSLLGGIAACSGLAIAVYYLVMHWLSRIEVPGYASIIVAVMILGGLQLLALGIHGEYIGRLLLNVNRKPQYTIRSVVMLEPESLSHKHEDSEKR